jgi:hypothetical protein
MSFPVNSISQTTPETIPTPIDVKTAMNSGKLIQEDNDRIATQKHDDLILAARWLILFRVSEPGDATPAIRPKPRNPDVISMAILLGASEPMDPSNIWYPCAEDTIEHYKNVLWADVTNVGTFDKTACLDKLAITMFENRPITRTELILALKCDYIAKHRTWAISCNFKFGDLVRTFRRRCGTKYTPCICSYIEPNHMYS